MSNTGSPKPVGTPRAAHSNPAERIAVLARALDALYHAGGDVRVGAARDVVLDLAGAHQLRVDARFDVLDALDVGDYLDAEFGRQPLAGYGAAGDAPDGLAGAGASAAHPVADSVFGVVGVVGVGRAVFQAHLFVVAAAGVAVADDYLNGRPQRNAVEDAGDYLGLVALAPLGGYGALPRTAAVELALDVRLRDGESRRATVHRHPDGVAVGLAPSGYLEHGSERVCHQVFLI